MEEQTKVEQNWMKDELKELNDKRPATEQLPGLKMEENKLYEIEVDVSKPWEKWVDPETKAVKKILPVTCEGQKYSFWLNCANPLYKQILEACTNGQTKFKIIRNGTAKATRYNIIK